MSLSKEQSILLYYKDNSIINYDDHFFLLIKMY